MRVTSVVRRLLAVELGARISARFEAMPSAEAEFRNDLAQLQRQRPFDARR